MEMKNREDQAQDHNSSSSERTKLDYEEVLFSLCAAKCLNLTEIENTLQILFQNGWDINCRNNEGFNVLGILADCKADDKWKVLLLLIRHGITVFDEFQSGKKFYEEFFSKDDRHGKELVEHLATYNRTLGWHLECSNCFTILEIDDWWIKSFQHQIMFKHTTNYLEWVLNLFNEHSDPSSKDKPSACQNLPEWLKTKASENPLFELFPEIHKQTLGGDTHDSSRFNCDKFEIFLRAIAKLAGSIGGYRLQDTIECFHLLPFNYPSLRNEKVSEENQLKDNRKNEWEKILVEWAHNPNERYYGFTLEELVRHGCYLPDEPYTYKCHGQH